MSTPNALQTTHALDFESCPDNKTEHMRFRIGTCQGLWGCTRDSYYILSIANLCKGNGHLDDVFEWFEFACKRDDKNLLVLVIMTTRFYMHLLKRGFIPLDTEGENVIKVFNQKSYRHLLRKGNSILRKDLTTV